MTDRRSRRHKPKAPIGQASTTSMLENVLSASERGSWGYIFRLKASGHWWMGREAAAYALGNRSDRSSRSSIASRPISQTAWLTSGRSGRSWHEARRRRMAVSV